MWVGENHSGQVREPWVEALIMDKASDFDTLEAWLKAHPGPLPVRTVRIRMSVIEFIALFKRFSVMLTRRGLGLVGREYQHDDDGVEISGAATS